MDGIEYLQEMIGKRATESLDKDKAKAITHMFNRMCNRGVDPIEFFDQVRMLLDIKDREGQSTKPKLYKLHTYSDLYDGAYAIVLANDETEARVIASDNNHDERFLESSSCELVNTKEVGTIHYYTEC